METNATHRTTAQDRKSKEWLVGLRIGLMLAEEVSEKMWQNGRIDVLDETGKIVFSAPYWKLAQLEREVAQEEEDRR